MAASVGVVVDADAFAPSAGFGAVLKALRLTGCAIPGCKRFITLELNAPQGSLH